MSFLNHLKSIFKVSHQVESIYTSKAPEPVGPYSQAIRLSSGGQFLFCSGQIPLSPGASQITALSIEEQTKIVFENTKAVLFAAGMSWKHVIKTTVFLKDMNSFQAFNQVYSSYFKDLKPARSCVEVSALPKGALVEMEVLGYKA